MGKNKKSPSERKFKPLSIGGIAHKDPAEVKKVDDLVKNLNAQGAETSESNSIHNLDDESINSSVIAALDAANQRFQRRKGKIDGNGGHAINWTQRNLSSAIGEGELPDSVRVPHASENMKRPFARTPEWLENLRLMEGKEKPKNLER